MATSKKNLEAKRLLVTSVAQALEREFPDAKCALHHNSPEQLLFATVLSAQCTDERVNKVTPALFEKYPTSKELAKAPLSEVARLIGSVNFFRTKAKNLIAAAQLLQKNHPHSLPKTIEELTTLPGVGRKTANVVLGECFGLPLGIVVDTHVRRLSQRIGLSRQEDPIKIEHDLMQFVPQSIWTKISHWLILHGRKTCNARKPNCPDCVIRLQCAYGRNKRELL